MSKKPQDKSKKDSKQPPINPKSNNAAVDKNDKNIKHEQTKPIIIHDPNLRIGIMSGSFTQIPKIKSKPKIQDEDQSELQSMEEVKENKVDKEDDLYVKFSIGTQTHKTQVIYHYLKKKTHNTEQVDIDAGKSPLWEYQKDIYVDNFNQDIKFSLRVDYQKQIQKKENEDEKKIDWDEAYGHIKLQEAMKHNGKAFALKIEMNKQSIGHLIVQIIPIDKNSPPIFDSESVKKLKKQLKDTGIEMSFKIIFAEILDKNIPYSQMYDFTAFRLRQIGQDLENIKNSNKQQQKDQSIEINNSIILTHLPNKLPQLYTKIENHNNQKKIGNLNQKEQAAKEKAARELAAKEQAAIEQAAREKAAKEQAEKEHAAKEQEELKKNVKDKRVKDKAIQEQVVKQQPTQSKKK